MTARFIAVLSVVACGLVSGCSASGTVSGGLAGHVQDRWLYKAESDFDYVYRGMGVTAALAKVATNNTKNSGNTKQAIAQINGLTDTLGAMYTTARAECGALPLAADKTVCNSGVVRLRFQSLTADLDSQLLNLAAVALKTDELRSLLTDVSNKDVVAALLDAISASGDMAAALQDAYAVKRTGKQGLAYILLQDKQGATLRNFQDAQALLQTLKPDEPGTGALDADAYAVPLFALFQDIRQSCETIRATLPNADKKTTFCPNTFPFSGIDGACISTKGLRIDPDDYFDTVKTALAKTGCPCVSSSDNSAAKCVTFDGQEVKTQ